MGLLKYPASKHINSTPAYDMTDIYGLKWGGGGVHVYGLSELSSYFQKEKIQKALYMYVDKMYALKMKLNSSHEISIALNNYNIYFLHYENYINIF